VTDAQRLWQDEDGSREHVLTANDAMGNLHISVMHGAPSGHWPSAVHSVTDGTVWLAHAEGSMQTKLKVVVGLGVTQQTCGLEQLSRQLTVKSGAQLASPAHVPESAPASAWW
jgi:hypothetical protein